VIEILHYVSKAGVDLLAEWLKKLPDDRARARIADRMDRLARGNFGDHKSLGRGLFELRIDWGPGYRIYYAMIGRACVVLFCGGDKRKQGSDIDRARGYFNDYLERTRIQ
jgi:putative addiction module killer protein